MLIIFMVGLCHSHYPIQNFKWLCEDQMKNKSISDWIQYINNKVSGNGKIYEVDLDYPEELHHLHNDYPCAAEKIKVTD